MDLNVSWTGDLANGSSWEAFGHVTNLFDRDPPIVASFSTFTGTAGQTNLTLHDVLGRRWTAGFRYRF